MSTMANARVSRLPFLDRLQAQIRVEETGCWTWLGHVSHRGYGHIRYAEGSGTRHVHRLAYEALVGPIPDGMTLDHLCHTADPNCAAGDSCPHRRCVNPAHMEPVTVVENVMRGNSPAARNARKTHCKHGHAFTPENTAIVAGGRDCRTCRNAAKRRRRALAKAGS